MFIPTFTSYLVNPSFENPGDKSIVYKFTSKDLVFNREGIVIYHFPYFKNVFWTNFKYTFGKGDINLKVGLTLITSDRFEYDIFPDEEKEESVWLDTKWPFPSTNSDKDHCGLYLKFQLSSSNLDDLEVEIVGFKDLLPDVENYLMISSLNTYQFVISNYEGEELLNTSSSMFNVENLCYIQDILPKAIQINLIPQF